MPKKPIYGFFHFYYAENLPNIIIRWCQIFEEIFYSIKLSGLLDATERLTICIVGMKEGDKNSSFFRGIVNKHSNVDLFFFERSDEFEFPTLLKLWQTSLKRDCYVYYCHSKGASYKENKGMKGIIRVDHWRHKLLLTTIVNWRRCVEILDNGFSTCGYQRDKRKKLKNTYAGNFFWANSSHVKKLTKPILKKDRFDAEHWINKMISSYVDLHLEEERKFVK